MTEPRLLDHRVLVTAVRQGGQVPLANDLASPDQKRARDLYFAPTIRSAIHTARADQTPDLAAALQPPRGRLHSITTAVAPPRMPPALSDLRATTLSLSFEVDTVQDLLTHLDTARLQRPWWHGQELPQWGTDGVPLHAAIEHTLGGDAVFEDPRLHVWTVAVFDRDPGPAVRYRLTAVDPPDMPLPPSDLLNDMLTRHAVRRWEAAGTTHAFCHYAGATVFGPSTPMEQVPAWLLHQFTGGVYQELTAWALLHAAVRATVARSLPVRGSHGDLPGLLHAHWERLRVSEQDQGRELHRAILGAIEFDRGDLEAILRVQP